MTSNRAKYWFITINKGAKCFDKVFDITLEQTNCTYYLILHDRDNIKQEHYHLVILYQNARTFESISKKYEGAHIEQCDYPVKAIRYLIHKDNPEKEPYTIDEIQHNDDRKHLEEIMQEQLVEPFDPNKIQYYYYEGYRSFLDFYGRFGANINKYISLIKNVIYELDLLERAKARKKALDDDDE